IPAMGTDYLVVGNRVLVSPEGLDIDTRSVAGHGRELPPSDEPTPQRDQLIDSLTVSGARELGLERQPIDKTRNF
ncbi:MAG TPA: hypothetical protein VGM75_24220, partial [Pseudonocardiaceae bacterium]